VRRFVAYQSFASNLVPGDTNGTRDIFLTDRETGQTIRVNVSTAGAQADGTSFNTSLSEDGAWVGFSSDATNLVPEDTNGASDGFVRGAFG
jgi:TolB protein